MSKQALLVLSILITNFLTIPLWVTSGCAHEEKVDCEKTVITSEIHQCNWERIDQLDKKLNLVYQQLMKIISSKEKTYLRNSQRAWNQFQKNYCDFRAEFERPGTLSMLIYDGCYEDLLKDKVQVLSKDLKRLTEFYQDSKSGEPKKSKK